MSWYRYEPSRPRRVDGGIKARSKRGRIGEQWWSRRFIDILESYGMGGRLGRGRTYARAGQVLKLELEPGIVAALVQGSRARPYRVTIEVDCLDEDEWQDVEDALAQRAVFRAKLLAGEMPQEIEEVFDAAGVALFPEDLTDFEMTCSCPDWGFPCKHLAAVLYVLAERFDDDPFAVLLWRGQERDDLLARLRSHGRAGADPAVAPTARAAAVQAAPVEDDPLAECLDRYWEPAVSFNRLHTREPVPAAPPDLLLRVLAPPAIQVRRRTLTEILTPAYERLGPRDADTGVGLTD